MEISQDDNRSAACEGKEKYTAQRAAQVKKRYPKAASYKCQFCGFFHLGRKSNKKRRMKRR